MSQDYKMNYANETLQRYSDVDVFSTEGRIGRKRYFVYSVIVPLIVFWGIASIAALTSLLTSQNTHIFYAIMGIAILAALFVMARLTIQRCHDMNKSGALSLLALIPFANIIFALIPGTNGLNQYGEVPKPASGVFNIAFFGLIVAVAAGLIFAFVTLANSSLVNNLINLF